MNGNTNNALIVGLTGPLGAGKSEVGRDWADRGAGLVIGDIIGIRALLQDKELPRRLADRFGAEILEPDGSINRPLLAKIAFSSPENQRDLTNITFPSLYRIAREEIEVFAQVCDVVVFDAALIFEWGVEKDFDWIVTVTAPIPTLIARALMRGGLTREEVIARLETQIPPEEKARRANRVIVNDGTLDDLLEESESVWEEIQMMVEKKNS